jgi:hypothetical protein
MESVAPARALARRARQLLQWAFVVFSIGIFLVVVGAVAFVIQLLPVSHPSYGLYHLLASGVFVVGVVLVLTGLALAIRAFTRRTENDLAQLTGEFLQQQLDAQYVFIRNINRFGLGYIDAVLLGPPGVLVFRILDKQGGFANEKAKWLWYNRQQWKTMRISPTVEVVTDIEHLRVYLERRQLNAEVFGVVVFIGSAAEVEFHLQDPVVPVAHLTELLNVLQPNYFSRKDRLQPQQIVTIRRLLLEDVR